MDESDQDNTTDNCYMLYTETEMSEFVNDRTVIEKIRGHLKSRYIEALCDLIIYTDIYDPDILVESLCDEPDYEVSSDEISNEDRLWFISNPVIINVMYPMTYTNILNNWVNYLSDYEDVKEFIEAFSRIITPDAPGYNEDIARNWLAYRNITEMIAILSEFSPKYVIISGADGMLFKFLTTMLTENLRLSRKIMPMYNDEVQTYLDMLGNYIVPQIKRCAPEIVGAYEAMVSYLLKCGLVYHADIPRDIYILFARPFHPKDREIFQGICNAFIRMPEFINMDLGYYSTNTIFKDCCSFDLPDELERILVRCHVLPNTLVSNTYNLKIISELLYNIAIIESPDSKSRLMDVIIRLGLLTAYQEWFRNATYNDLKIISSCQFPLVAFTNEASQPEQAIVNLQDYQSPALVIQLLSLYDQTNIDMVLTAETDRLIDILETHNVRIYIPAPSSSLPQNEINKIKCLIDYTRSINFHDNKNLVKNKIYQIARLRDRGFIHPDFYDDRERDIYQMYIYNYSGESAKLISDLAELFSEYPPKYTEQFLEFSIKSGANFSDDFGQLLELLINYYPDILTINRPTIRQFVASCINTDSNKTYYPPITQIPRVATCLKLLYPGGLDDNACHNDILLEFIDMKIHNFYDKISPIDVIKKYSSATGYGFQLNEILIEKLLEEISPESKKLPSSTFLDYCSVLSRHTNLDIARDILCWFLDLLFISDDNLAIIGIIKVVIPHSTELTPEICEYVRIVLADTSYQPEFNAEITQGLSIRATNAKIKKQAVSRWRNWCAIRQISFTQTGIPDIFGDEANPFCPISYESIQPEYIVLRIKKCRHIFIAGYIDKWCQDNPSCPMCRTELPSGKLDGANCEMFEIMCKYSIKSGLTSNYLI